MHWGDWNGGAWWWFGMLLMMAAFWGAVAWVVVTAIRRPGEARNLSAPGRSAAEILAERLARGEIDVEEYQRRVDALRDKVR